jgi:Protein of unknown function (DUF3276)
VISILNRRARPSLRLSAASQSAEALLNREGNMGIRGEVFSSRASTEKRTYFFNVKENRNGDLFLNIVESKKHGDADFERRSVIVFAEDLDEFVQEFQKAVSFMSRRKS